MNKFKRLMRRAFHTVKFDSTSMVFTGINPEAKTIELRIISKEHSTLHAITVQQAKSLIRCLEFEVKTLERLENETNESNNN